VTRSFIALAVLVAVAGSTYAGGVPLVDATGAAHGSVVVNLARGQVKVKALGLAPLPAPVSATPAFTAYAYKAYLSSSTDPAIEVFLTDLYPNAKQVAVRRIALGGDVSRMGCDRVAITAFSKDGQQSSDVLTASFTP
jgi:hypothetical protein